MYGLCTRALSTYTSAALGRRVVGRRARAHPARAPSAGRAGAVSGVAGPHHRLPAPGGAVRRRGHDERYVCVRAASVARRCACFRGAYHAARRADADNVRGALARTADGLSIGYVALFLAGCAVLTERSVWGQRTRRGLAFLSACPFDGARGGGLLMNAYVAAGMAFPAVAVLFHLRMLGVKAPKTPDDHESKDGRLFVAIVCVGLDAASLFTAAAIATAEKFVESEDAAVQVQEMAVVRHVLAALVASFNPCALTAPYLFYALLHLWRWTMRSGCGARRSGSLVASSGSTTTCGRAWLLSHKLLGYYTGVHIFCIYLCGVNLEGISIAVPSPLAQMLGLLPLASWSWAAWACHSCLLLLFFASFTKVQLSLLRAPLLSFLQCCSCSSGAVICGGGYSSRVTVWPVPVQDVCVRVRAPVYLSVCLIVCLSVCLPVCMRA